MRMFLSLFLALTVTLGAAGGGPVSPGRPQAVDWADMTYVRYDPAPFSARAGQLADHARAGDGRGVLALYDELYGELARIDTLAAIAYIRYSADVTDPYWSQEMAYSDRVAVEAADTLMTVCHSILNGPCAGVFADHVGPRAAEAFRGYVPMTEQQAELTARETELVDQYYELMADADSVTYTYLGQTWDRASIAGYQGVELAYRDYDGYLEVSCGLQKAVNDQVGPVFTQLVQLRAELARIAGYESYSDMAYRELYGRDYTCADAQMLCDAVKAVGPAYYQLLYAGVIRSRTAVSPARDGAALVDVLGRYAARLDPVLEAPWQFMTDHGLCDVSRGEDRSPSSFTIALSQYGSCFIFAGLSGDSGDMGTLTHEFGHFVNSYYHPAADLLTDRPCFDLLEIHSTGLEALFTLYYDEIYRTGSDDARACELAGLLRSLLEGCIFDEFQRQIYARPDMTLDEMNRLYARICAQYGQYEALDVDYSWMYVPHTFESPLYYISYAASALAAIQIWDMAQTDPAAGVDAWKAVLAHDAGREGYLDVLADCGLRLFTEPGAVEAVCRPLLAVLAEN